MNYTKLLNFSERLYIAIINGVIVVFKNQSTNFYGCK